MRSLLVGISSLALMGAAPAPDASPASPAASSPGGEAGIAYRGYVLGIPMLKSNINASFADGTYKADALFETAGLAALFKQVKVVAKTSGVVQDGTMSTRHYWHQEIDGKKNRQVFMDHDEAGVKVRIDPPIRNMGNPPASAAQKREAMDAISAVLQIALQAGQHAAAAQCTGKIKVFDGKQRYDLILTNKGLVSVKTKAYSGKAVQCEARYLPLAGFDADDLQKAKTEYDHPITMWLAQSKTAGLRLPVRFSYKLPFGTAVVEAKQINSTS